MKKIKINRIRAFNFKLFEDIDLRFNNAELVILDGPNGYGKTSIYDCIELLITGKIDRIMRREIDGRATFSDNILTCDPHADCSYIRIEFLVDDKSFTLSRHASWENKGRNKPNDFSAFKLYRLPNIETREAEKFIIDEKEMEQFFGENLSISYPVMYYIEQEESTFYLKQSEKERREHLSYLFNTTKEEKELSLIKEKDKQLKNLLEKIELEKSKNENKLNTLNNDLLQVTNTKTAFSRLFPDSEIGWDVEEPAITLKQYSAVVLTELEQILFLKKNAKSIKQARLNKELEKFLNDDEVMQFLVSTYRFIDELSEVKRVEKTKKILLEARKTLSESKNIEGIAEFENIDKVFDIVQYDENEVKKTKEKIEELLSQKQNVENQKKFYNSFNEARNALIDNFKRKHSNEDAECPLCGTDFKEVEKLDISFQEKEKLFNKYYGNTFKKHGKELRTFLAGDIADLLLEINLTLSSLENKFPASFCKQLIVSQPVIDKGKKLVSVLQRLETDIDLYCFEHKNFSSKDVKKSVSLLKKHLESLVKTVDDEFYEEKYFQCLRKFFDGKFSHIEKISESGIKSKRSYIELKIFESQNETIKKTKALIKKQKDDSFNIRSFRTKIKRIIAIYTENINIHKTKIISAIEIPFFVYSGRVIQSFNRGIGFFIDTTLGEELKSIKFLAGHGTDHDAVMSLSSGQLSALIIAFTLALNKVYAQHGILLIDDPVQTMDEINILSLVELLRSDFSERQIILSTHEDHISMFLKYKFGISGCSVETLNLKTTIFDKVLSMEKLL